MIKIVNLYFKDFKHCFKLLKYYTYVNEIVSRMRGIFVLSVLLYQIYINGDVSTSIADFNRDKPLESVDVNSSFSTITYSMHQEGATYASVFQTCRSTQHKQFSLFKKYMHDPVRA